MLQGSKTTTAPQHGTHSYLIFIHVPLYIAIIKLLFNANLAVQLVTTCIFDHFVPFLDFRKRLINDTVKVGTH